jgi:hypothetical protein
LTQASWVAIRWASRANLVANRSRERQIAELTGVYKKLTWSVTKLA